MSINESELMEYDYKKKIIRIRLKEIRLYHTKINDETNIPGLQCHHTN